MSQPSSRFLQLLAAVAAVSALAIAPAATAAPGHGHSTSQGSDGSHGKHLGQTKPHTSSGHHTGSTKSSSPGKSAQAPGHTQSSHPGKSAQAPGHTKAPGTHSASPTPHSHGHGHGHGVKDPAGDPPGNNGTVKISLIGDRDGTPNNVPHPGCGFEVQWYGYDAGADVVSVVSFTPQAPTKSVTIGVDGPLQVAVGGDPASGAGTPTGLDAVQTYTLTFSGAAPAKQGYHVRVTVSTPHSLGNDTKTKVFWVSPCTTSPGSQASGTGTGSAGAPLTGPVAGAHVELGTAGGPAREAAVGTTPAVRGGVPTSVEAGASRHGIDAWVHSPWPLVIAGLGALMAALGVARMRRRA